MVVLVPYICHHYIFKWMHIIRITISSREIEKLSILRPLIFKKTFFILIKILYIFYLDTDMVFVLNEVYQFLGFTFCKSCQFSFLFFLLLSFVKGWERKSGLESQDSKAGSPVLGHTPQGFLHTRDGLTMPPQQAASIHNRIFLLVPLLSLLNHSFVIFYLMCEFSQMPALSILRNLLCVTIVITAFCKCSNELPII